MKSFFFSQKGILLGLLCVVLISFLGWEFFWRESHSDQVFHEVRIDDQVFQLERADTDEERALGLGYRDSLCDTCGMLFQFPEPGMYPFWMKGMRFPLDIIWLDGNRVVFIVHAASPSSLELFTSPEPANAVLEVNAGSARNIERGDTLSFR
ncbi:MAG: DUF192 domain-containing protein [Patescibacteria group bacterium]